MTNFRLFQTERVCTGQFQTWWKWQNVFQTGRKHCGKRMNCSLRAIHPFPAVFSKRLALQTRKNQGLVGKGLTPFLTVFQSYHGDQCTYQCFPGVLLTSTPHNILPKLLAAFPHSRNNEQRSEKNGSCRNDSYQFSERISAEKRIETATSRPPLRYRLSYGVQSRRTGGKLW